MNLPFILSAVGLAILVAGILITMLDRAEKMQARKSLALRLSQTRFMRILDRLGIAPDRYLKSTPAGEVKGQIATCEKCAKTMECETALATDAAQEIDGSLCPNHYVIQKLLPPAAQDALHEAQPGG